MALFNVCLFVLRVFTTVVAGVRERERAMCVIVCCDVRYISIISIIMFSHEFNFSDEIISILESSELCIK